MSEHATRARYQAGCRCDDCRAANTAYQQDRKRGPKREVPAELARREIRRLRRLGLGLETIADVAGHNKAGLMRIMRGDIQTVYLSTVEKLRSVDEGARPDGNYVPADRTRQVIASLLDAGYTKRCLAKWLGSRSNPPQLTFGMRDHVRLRTQFLVERLAERIDAGLMRRER